ncbi:DUF6758 family protein [Micromonospora sp. M12]
MSEMRGPVRAPDLMNTDSRCALRPGAAVARARAHRSGDRGERGGTDHRDRGSAGDAAVVPVAAAAGWTLTGVAYAGDERTGVRATLVACAGPAPSVEARPIWSSWPRNPASAWAPGSPDWPARTRDRSWSTR